jgi:hypothetical protein
MVSQVLQYVRIFTSFHFFLFELPLQFLFSSSSQLGTAVNAAVKAATLPVAAVLVNSSSNG